MYRIWCDTYKGIYVYSHTQLYREGLYIYIYICGGVVFHRVIFEARDSMKREHTDTHTHKAGSGAEDIKSGSSSIPRT